MRPAPGLQRLPLDPACKLVPRTPERDLAHQFHGDRGLSCFVNGPPEGAHEAVMHLFDEPETRSYAWPRGRPLRHHEWDRGSPPFDQRASCSLYVIEHSPGQQAGRHKPSTIFRGASQPCSLSQVASNDRPIRAYVRHRTELVARSVYQQPFRQSKFAAPTPRRGIIVTQHE